MLYILGPGQSCSMASFFAYSWFWGRHPTWFNLFLCYCMFPIFSLPYSYILVLCSRDAHCTNFYYIIRVRVLMLRNLGLRPEETPKRHHVSSYGESFWAHRAGPLTSSSCYTDLVTWILFYSLNSENFIWLLLRVLPCLSGHISQFFGPENVVHGHFDWYHFH